MANKIRIGDGEDCGYLVCTYLTDPLIFPDNLIDQCFRCRRAVQYRPHGPKGPVRICYECVGQDLDREAATGDLDIVMTPESAAELSAYMRRKGSH